MSTEIEIITEIAQHISKSIELAKSISPELENKLFESNNDFIQEYIEYFPEYYHS